MSVRRLVVEVDPSTVNVTAFCRQHGISTWFFWDLRRRYAREGEEVLEPGSRAPHCVANRTPAAMEDEIVAMRKELTELGLDAGPATIGFHLRRRLDEAMVPSDSGIWRVLSRHGLIIPDPSKAPKHAGRSFEAERANECWQIDDTGWQLAEGTEVKIINVVDDHSRVAVSSLAVLACTAAVAFAAFSAGAARWGWPARFLSDNAKAFRHSLAEMLHHLGIAAGHSRPYHPQTCGKVGGSTRLSSATSPPKTHPKPSRTSRPSSMGSSSSTTTTGPTAPSTGSSPPSSGTRPPRADPPTSPSAPRQQSTTSPSALTEP